MGLDSDITLAAGVLIVFVILFAYVLKTLSKAFTLKFSRLDRKLNDVAIYLSHVNEDKVHMEAMAKNKIEKQWAENQFLNATSEFKGQKEEGRARLKIMISQSK
ncbi:MAG: hypothetical protein V1835_05995 [Candidatus Micrarchaeota archaeon]